MYRFASFVTLNTFYFFFIIHVYASLPVFLPLLSTWKNLALEENLFLLRIMLHDNILYMFLFMFFLPNIDHIIICLQVRASHIGTSNLSRRVSLHHLPQQPSSLHPSTNNT